MLKGLDPMLTPELLYALAQMGHGDEIAVVDANFPATSVARRLITLDGASAPRALTAILSVMPLDHMAEHPARVMAVVGKPREVPPAVAEFAQILEVALGHKLPLEPVERHAFYAQARNAFAILRTGERRPYGNILLSKGVIDPQGLAPQLPRRRR